MSVISRQPGFLARCSSQVASDRAVWIYQPVPQPGSRHPRWCRTGSQVGRIDKCDRDDRTCTPKFEGKANTRGSSWLTLLKAELRRFCCIFLYLEQNSKHLVGKFHLTVASFYPSSYHLSPRPQPGIVVSHQRRCPFNVD